MFPLALALGLDPLTMTKDLTGGMGNTANMTYFAQIEIDCGFGIRFKSMVGFTSGLETMGMGLLGQTGFFENYHTLFAHDLRIFSVEVPD